MSTKKILCMLITFLMMFSVFTANISASSVEDALSDSSTADECYPSTSDEDIATSDEEPQRLLGDADSNNTVNVKDATLIRRFIADLSTLDEISQIYADVDRNEAVNIKDATVIQKYVADIYVKESVGYPYDADPDTYRYYFYMPEDWLNESTAQTGNTAGIYWWDGTNSHTSWPGIPARRSDVEGIYYYDVPTDVTTIIWNNFVDGGADNERPEYFDSAQTCNIGTEYYDPMESEFYPEGTKNFDGMIYVIDPELYPYSDFDLKMVNCGEWFYYYGNGEYGTSPVRGESKVLTGDTFDGSSLFLFNNPPGTYRYYFYLPEDWLNESTATTGNTAGIYWWEGTGYHDGWPGVPAMKGDVDGVYYYDVPTDVWTIIWNNYFHGGIDSSAPYYNDVHMTKNIGTEFYYPGESEFYPEGLTNFDGMIYVVDPTLLPVNAVITRPEGIGEWFYYYGNGEYGTSPVRGESKILTGDTFDYNSLLLDNNPPETYRYYFYMPIEWINDSTQTTGNTAGIYWWEGTGAQESYPGLKANEADVEGVYYCDVPADVTNIIWNNYFDGGNDITAPYYADAIPTRDINVDGYAPGQSKYYPEGIESFDGMIFVTDFADYDYNDYSGKLQFGGEWFYYYGNGEYGTAPVRGESEILTDYALNNDPFISDNEVVD